MTARIDRLVRRGAIALAVAATIGLSGCVPTAQPDVEATLSAELTSAVSGVADTATTGDYSGALGRLDQLSASVDAAGADGRISAERLATLQSAIATVRADLEALLAAATQPEQSTPEPAQTSEAPVESPATQEPVQQQPGQQEEQQEPPKQQPTGPGENPGKGPGNDKGNDKKDDKGPGAKG